MTQQAKHRAELEIGILWSPRFGLLRSPVVCSGIKLRVPLGTSFGGRDACGGCLCGFLSDVFRACLWVFGGEVSSRGVGGVCVFFVFLW